MAFVIGKATQEEIETLKNRGYEVKVLTQEEAKATFLILYGAYDEETCEEYAADKFICYYIPCDAIDLSSNGG